MPRIDTPKASCMSLNVDTSRFRRAAASLLAGVEQQVESMLHEEQEPMIEAVGNATPPAHDAISLSEGIQHGRTLVEADVHRVVIPVAATRAVMTVRDAMSRYRVKGRVPSRLAKRIPVARADMQAYIAEKKDRVGNLARGWFARVRTSGGRISFVMGNAVAYASNVVGLRLRANAVLHGEWPRLQDRVQTAVAAAARAAGFKS